MTNTIDSVSQGFEPGQLVELFQLDLTALGGSILYLSNGVNGTSAIVYNTNTYTPIAIEAEGFEMSGEGSLPTPTIRIQSTVSLQASMNSYKDFIGATLTRIRTFKRFLDGEIDASTVDHFPIDVYKVERKVISNKELVEWELAASLDQEGITLPRRKMLKDVCMARYRTWNGASFDYIAVEDGGCPYSGTDYYDVEGNVVAQALDKCGKRFSECERRYGTAVALPFYGFPGISNRG